MVSLGDTMKSAAAKSAPAEVKSFWDNRVVRKIRGVKVSFYKRYDGSCYTMDFKVNKRRVRALTDAPVITDAEVVAGARIKELQEAGNGVAAAAAERSRGRASVSTVGQVIDLLEAEGEGKIWKDGTARTYKSALLSLARSVSEGGALKLGLDAVLTKGVIEAFYAQKQGLKSAAPNWVDVKPANGGANAIVRNVKSLFRERSVDLHMKSLKLPDLRELRDAHFLKPAPSEFQPWEDAVYDAMEAASVVLKAEKPELWLVNAMLRRLGLRDEELLQARREWIEVQYEGAAFGPPRRRAWLVIANRGTEFTLLKNGKQRKLELDPELQEVLLPRTGHLIADGWKDSTRYDLIYRAHSKWMRPFVGEEAAKTNHQLRKYAASKIYTEHGLEAAAYFLGDTVATTEKYYKAWLGVSPMLNGADVARARAA
jgi:hypothetical protein